MAAIADDDKLSLLKSEIHCILVSTRKGLTIKEFLNDYKETIGKAFPHTAFGFKSPMDLLRSIPDSITISKPCDGPELILPVVKGSSAHINKLVLGQKSESKGRLRRPRPFQLPTDSRTETRKPLRLKTGKPELSPTFRGWENSTSGNMLNQFSYIQPNHHYPTKLEEFHEQNIFSNNWSTLTVSSSSKYSQSYFQQPPLPYKSLSKLQCPQSLMPENQFIINKQPGMHNQQPEMWCQLPPANSHPLLADSHQHIEPTERPINYKYNTEGSQNLKAIKLHDSETELSYENTIPEDLQNGIEEQDDNSLHDENDLQEDYSHYDDDDDDVDSSIIGDKLKTNFRKILEDHKNGILVTKFSLAYKKTFGVSLNHNDLGFQSMKELVMACPDVFIIMKTKRRREWILFDCRSSEISADDSSKWIPKSVLENMEELSNLYPKGISSDDILKTYQDYFKVTLDIKKLGFESMTSFLVNCQSIDCTTQDDTCLVFPINWGKKRDYLEPEEDEFVPDPTLSLKNVQFLWQDYFLENTCNPTCKFQSFELPKENTFKVRVSDVCTPSSFYLQDASSYENLTQLMYNLNVFYDEDEEKYMLKEEMIIPGLVCCLKFLNEWHRAVVLQRKGDLAKVSFVDYGTVSISELSEIRMLHKQFASLPVQAIKAKLSGIVPYGGRTEQWSSEALDYFQNSCYGYVLIAEIIAVYKEKTMLEVVLIDTRGDEDVIISNEFISRQFASPLNVISANNLPEICYSKPDLQMSYPECFLQLLPSWLNLAGDWSELVQLFDEAKFKFFNEGTKHNSLDLPPSCCSHHFLTQMFTKKPNEFCEIWSETMASFSSLIEEQFTKDLCSKLCLPINYTNLKKLCYLSDTHLPQENCSPTIDCYPIPKEKSNQTLINGFGNKDIVKGDGLRLDIPNKTSKNNGFENGSNIAKHSSTNSQVVRSVISARFGDKFLTLIRFENNIFTILDELLHIFAKNIPQALVRHRLASNRSLDTIILSSKVGAIYRELFEKNLITGKVRIVPLEKAGDVVLSVNPSLIAAADTIKALAKECSLDHHFWYENN